MNIRDLYKEGKGLFHYLNEIGDIELLNDFQDISTTDLLFVSQHGSRKVSPLVNNLIGEKENVKEEDLKLIASMLYGMYADKWNKLAEVYKAEIPLETYNLTTTEKTESDSSNITDYSNTSNDKQTNSVAGYNSEDFADSDENTQSSTNTGDNSEITSGNETRTSETKGNTSNAIDDREKAVRYLNNKVLVENIFQDVSQTVGTLVY